MYQLILVYSNTIVQRTEELGKCLRTEEYSLRVADMALIDIKHKYVM